MLLLHRGLRRLLMQSRRVRLRSRMEAVTVVGSRTVAAITEIMAIANL